MVVGYHHSRKPPYIHVSWGRPEDGSVFFSMFLNGSILEAHLFQSDLYLEFVALGRVRLCFSCLKRRSSYSQIAPVAPYQVRLCFIYLTFSHPRLIYSSKFQHHPKTCPQKSIDLSEFLDASVYHISSYLSPIHFRKHAATDGTYTDLNIGETSLCHWFRAKSTTLFFFCVS